MMPKVLRPLDNRSATNRKRGRYDPFFHLSLSDLPDELGGTLRDDLGPVNCKIGQGPHLAKRKAAPKVARQSDREKVQGKGA